MCLSFSFVSYHFSRCMGWVDAVVTMSVRSHTHGAALDSPPRLVREGGTTLRGGPPGLLACSMVRGRRKRQTLSVTVMHLCSGDADRIHVVRSVCLRYYEAPYGE